jgi:hypothetical protein
VNRDERAIRVGLALAAAGSCVMCDGPAEIGGAFIPNDSEAWGGRPGKQRVWFYGICGDCHDSRTTDEVEARLDRARTT